MAKLLNNRTLIIIFLLVTALVSLQNYLFFLAGINHINNNHINNFIIYRTTYLHLINNIDIYLPFPYQFQDRFVYSPTFAVLMAPFAWLPYIISVPLWIGLNAYIIWSCIKYLPQSDIKKRFFVTGIIIFELITSLQNMQTNTFIAGFMILGFCFLEKKKPFWAALFIMLAAYVKVFGLAAALLFFFYPDKKKFILSMLFWGIVLIALPLLVVSPGQLFYLYKSWIWHLQEAHYNEEIRIKINEVYRLSVMGWLKIWFHFEPPSIIIQGIGTVLLLIPLALIKNYRSMQFRYFFVASVLIYCNIFNHIAESPSYIISVIGIALWYVNENRNKFNDTLLVLAFVFTTMSATDIFPVYIRQTYFYPYVVKAVPCILIWFYLQYRLLTGNFDNGVLRGAPVK